MILSLALLAATGTTYAAAVFNFGSHFLTAVSKDPQSNAIVSPVSAHMSLSMLANGLKGDTRKQVTSLLGNSIPDINEKASQYLAEIAKTTPLTMANGCWTVNGERMSDSFIDHVRTTYEAELGAVQSSNGADVINRWVTEKTKGRVEELLQQLSVLDRIVLANALAFDGVWKTQFDSKLTREAEFNTGVQKVKVSMMHIESSFRCGEWGESKVVELPYEQGYVMLAMLPGEGEAPLDMMKQLEGINWANLPALLHQRKATVAFPKFKASIKIDLKQPIVDMGAGKLFIFSHDFDGVVAKPTELAVGQAVQKVFIDVDEKGTKAAAATAIVLQMKSARRDDPFVFNANRPFGFVLMDAKNRIPILMGVINNPTQ
jgi:serpin B